MVRKYRQLMPDQRNQIQRGLNHGLSIRGIARKLGRSPSTIRGREVSQKRRRKGVRKLTGGQLKQIPQ